MFSFPVHWDGLGLTMPCVSASLNFSASGYSIQIIVKAIKYLTNRFYLRSTKSYFI